MEQMFNVILLEYSQKVEVVSYNCLLLDEGTIKKPIPEK